MLVSTLQTRATEIVLSLIMERARPRERPLQGDSEREREGVRREGENTARCHEVYSVVCERTSMYSCAIE